MRYLSSALIILGLIISGLNSVHAQDLDQDQVLVGNESPEPDSANGWVAGWRVSLNGSQAAYSNWSQGGVNAISGTGSSVFTAKYSHQNWVYLGSVNLKYGQTKLEGDEIRKTDDKIQLRNRGNYFFNEVMSGYASIHFRTQFDEGFDFEQDGNPLISDFMAPGYLSQALGISYQPVEFFNLEGGLGFKQTFVSIDSLATLYGVDQGENFRFESGLALSMSFSYEIMKNVVYTGSVDTFSNFQRELSGTDVIWSNELIGNINKIMNASLQFELQYDDDFSDQAQIKQVISLGIGVDIF